MWKWGPLVGSQIYRLKLGGTISAHTEAAGEVVWAVFSGACAMAR